MCFLDIFRSLCTAMFEKGGDIRVCDDNSVECVFCVTKNETPSRNKVTDLIRRAEARKDPQENPYKTTVEPIIARSVLNHNP